MSINQTISPDHVREVINTDLSSSNIESAIATAITLMEDVFSGCALSDNLQMEIMRYLAAHYVSIKDNSSRGSSIESEKIGATEVKYSSDTKTSRKGITTSQWWDTAVSLDGTGRLLSRGSVPPKLVSLDLDRVGSCYELV